MGCGMTVDPRKNGPFSLKEIELLQLMYNDLTKRSRVNRLEKEIFLTFFHLNGLWGEEIFSRFDQNNTGSVNFTEFKKGIETLVKGSYESKIHFLFAFYDIQKKNGISYDCLLKMLYSYPKEELKHIIQDQTFLTNMKDQERQYHFGKRKELDMLREVVQEESSTDHEMHAKQRKFSEAIGFREYSFNENALKFDEKPSNAHYSMNVDQRPWNHLLPPINRSCKLAQMQRKSSSMSFANIKEACKTKMCSNITLLVKKYASFLFKEFSLDKDRDIMRENQFFQLIKKHQRIFIFYYESFHNYIWELDGPGLPEFIRNTSWVEGPCIMLEYVQRVKHNRYLRFYKTTIFVFKFRNDNFPADIINMEGLFVQACANSDGYGFTIKHRDGLYPENTYLFKTKAIQEEWLRNLGIFMRNSIYDSYVLLQKIGAGNYSVVYKGIQKETSTAVAIKVIEKFKFSATQKEIIKQECSILQLCHHPNIVTLIDKFQSKTTLYIVTEYMSNGDLYDYVKSKKFLEEIEAATVVCNILQAVSYLNGLGIIHRDLKSENIMIRLDKEKGSIERAKIIDFGFAVYIANLPNMAEKERYAGTPNFAAPQILLGEQFDQKVDLFSLGVIMFFTLTGELPFDSIFVDEISRQSIECEPYYDQSHWCNISEDAKDLINKLLVKREKRITVTEALKHPWIKDRKNLKEYIGKNKRRKYM